MLICLHANILGDFATTADIIKKFSRGGFQQPLRNGEMVFRQWRRHIFSSGGGGGGGGGLQPPPRPSAKYIFRAEYIYFRARTQSATFAILHEKKRFGHELMSANIQMIY